MGDEQAQYERLAKEAISKLKACQANIDAEAAHGDADDILCELLEAIGFVDVVTEWEQVDKWYA